MIFLVIYLLGAILAIWMVVDIWKTAEFKFWQKLLVSFLTFIFSWIGIFVYGFVLKPVFLKFRRGDSN